MEQNPVFGLRLRGILAGIVLFGLVVHIFLYVFLTFSGSREPLGKSVPANVYQHIFHLGPFFREDAIKSSDHFIAGIKVDGNWTIRDITAEHVEEYHAHPWQTEELTLRDYIRESSRAFGYSKNRMQSTGFRKLFSLTKREFPTGRMDSVRWILVRKWYIPEKHDYSTDTVFNLSFDPADVD